MNMVQMDSTLTSINPSYNDCEIFGGANSVLEVPACNIIEQNALCDNYHRGDDVLEALLLNPKSFHAADNPTTYQCEICSKSFDNIKRYSGHLRVHTKEDLWNCGECPAEKFSTKKQLMQHVKTHHSTVIRKHHCVFCPMAFEISSRLKQHIAAIHFNYRPHTCEQCKKVFTKKSDLKKHKAVHDGNKNHICPSCGMKFSDESNLKRHTITHTKEKLYVCWACKGRFTQLASLKRHTTRCQVQDSIPLEYEISYGKKNYCQICGVPFQYKSDLVVHMANVHKSPDIYPEVNGQGTTIIQCAKHVNAVDHDHAKLCHDQNKDSIEKGKHTTKKPLPKLCGMTFTNKNNLTENSASIPKLVDQYENAFVNEILFGNDNNISNNVTMPRNDTLNIQETDGLLKEMNQLYSIDDELLYNDIDFDSMNPSQFFNTETDANLTVNDEIFFDYNEGNRSIDQDLMNALYQVKADHLPDELLNVKEKQVNGQSNSCTQATSNFLEPKLSVDGCSTIFERDIDLEASSNLAANLTQLIGENDVHYISRENDDMFIISLKNNIDAEQLTDMLNIDIELINNNNTANNNNDGNKSDKELLINTWPAVDPGSVDCAQEIDNKEIHENDKIFVCRTCNKKFKKKDNYMSHMGTHNPLLRRHCCKICNAKFSYRSTLNKHTRAAHEPRVARAHTCPLCDKPYKAAWMLKSHLNRNHFHKKPFTCEHKGCKKNFFKHSDLLAHKRTHTGERPYRCELCRIAFPQKTHLYRHRRTVHAKQKKGNDLVKGEKSSFILGNDYKAENYDQTNAASEQRMVH